MAVLYRRKENKKNKDGEAAEGEAVASQLTPEQAEAEKQKREKESSRKKADFLSKEHKLQAEVANLEWGVAATPLGIDRAYRRYWVFQSLPGLFVEHDDDYVSD
jgi:bromodomain adjacent to zinc finger domain protein 1A